MVTQTATLASSDDAGDNEADEISTEDTSDTVVNKSLQASMSHIWYLLIWLIVVTTEAFFYSLAVFVLEDPHCDV